MSKKPNQLVKSLDKALKILELVAKNNEPLGVTEISRETDLNKSTVYRILATLEYRGYISQNTHNEKYTTGIKLFEIGSQVIGDLDLREVVKPYLKELMGLTGETVHLGILDDGEVIYIEKVESPKTIRMYSKVGKRIYAHSTSLGKVLLAYSGEDKIDEIISRKGLPRQASNTITDPDNLKVHLEKVREQGYAVDDEENEEGIRCIAGPVFDHRGKIAAAFSISGPAIRITRAKVEEFSSLVKDYSIKMSKAMGYNNQTNSH